MHKFYRAAERLMWGVFFVAAVMYPWLAANYSMI